MKRLALLLLLVTAAGYGLAQEDCYDGIDNDADGDIDLNDDDCDCAGFGLSGDLTSLIPNPSFEDNSCCPTGVSQLYCADDWVQASDATSDYFNTCDFTHIGIFTPPDLPLPGAPGGAGYAGFYNNTTPWKEYIGACLTGPMTAGTSYVLNCWVARGNGDPNLTFSFYGTPDCADLPWSGSSCPVGSGGWELLDDIDLVLTTAGEWTEVTLSFTPTVDMNAVAMGADCPLGTPGSNYYYVDELTLVDSISFSGGNITETGDWCDGDLALNVDIDTTGGTWQWYYEGVALVGETSDILDVMGTGPGTYQCLYTIGGECEEMTYILNIPDSPVADFTYSDQCDGDPVDFTDASTITGGSITDWDWDFGDSNTSTSTSPTHTYGGPGTYTVDLTVTSDLGCQHTVSYDVVISPVPVADFEFEINGESSADGLTGGCILSPVAFIDGSSVAVPGTITDWDWDFGDANTSTDENPSHYYDAAGTYTITLTVTTDAGCTHSFQMDIVMTDSPTLDFILSDPTCFGFTDGSVTVAVSGAAPGDLDIEITNSTGGIENVGGSNAANELGDGWYYIHVDDGSGCEAYDSVYLAEPGALDADLDLTMPQCYGDETGYAVVDSVFNAQGDLGNITYIWNPDPPAVSGLGADSLWGLGAGTYTLTINDDNGCSNEVTFEITEPDELVFTELGFDPAYCRLFGYQSGNGVVYAAAGGGTPTYLYEWEGPLGDPDIDSTDNTTWGGLNPGDYQITVVDANGCVLTQVITMDSLNPVADFDVVSSELDANLEGTAVVCATFLNQSLYFANPNNPTADTTFWWNLDNPNASWILSKDVTETVDTCYAEGGEYEVCLVAQNKNGCVDTTCKIITVHTPLEIEPVNIFSPDGDGVNDNFTFLHVAKGIKEFHCVIVNRWGVTMAEIDDYATGWDGKDKSGSQCRDGVYFYVYEGEAENGEPFSGQGTLQIVGTGIK